MNKTLFPIRLVFLAMCMMGGWLTCYSAAEWSRYQLLGALIGLLIGALVVLTDFLLKGFSLRGLTAVTFGLGIGSLISYLVVTSPIFAGGEEWQKQIVRIVLFMVITYFSTVIAMRGKDEFNLVIPYVRFVPHEVDVPVVVVDTSALIDGRVARIYESGFLTAALVIPRFVLEELQAVADSADPSKQSRGRRGLETLSELRKVRNIDIRIPESDVAKRQDVDAKLVFLAQSMKAKLLTTDYNLAKMAEFHGVPWLNLNALSKALRPELILGTSLQVELIKPGKEEGQAVGFLEDGSMVVVNQGKPFIGQRVAAEITSILPSAGGKMIFAKLISSAV